MTWRSALSQSTSPISTRAPSNRPVARSNASIESWLSAPCTSALSGSNPAERRIADGNIPGVARCITPSNHKS